MRKKPSRKVDFAAPRLNIKRSISAQTRAKGSMGFNMLSKIKQVLSGLPSYKIFVLSDKEHQIIFHTHTPFCRNELEASLFTIYHICPLLNRFY